MKTLTLPPPPNGDDFISSSGTYVGDELPSPELEEEDAKSVNNEATPAATRQQSAKLEPAFSTARKAGRSRLVGSECDRPDSGFDSKDDQEEEAGMKAGEAEESEGSPELGEMSRQALTRQPVKKKRVYHHNMV